MTQLLLVGCGKMGGALLAGWLEQGVDAADVLIVDPHYSGTSAVRVLDSAEELPADFRPEIILLAIKPQMMEQVLPAYAHLKGGVFISIAAGRTMGSLERILGADTAILRAMPNLPVAVRRGVTALLPNKAVSKDQRALCDKLMRAVGQVVWVDQERHIDSVTAMSGSGPAYVFLMVEALAAAGQTLGLESEMAQTLARATVVGAGEMLHQLPESATRLRENVTSPKGTTYAALQVLGAPGGLTELIQKAVEAAANRARELAQ